VIWVTHCEKVIKRMDRSRNEALNLVASTTSTSSSRFDGIIFSNNRGNLVEPSPQHALSASLSRRSNDEDDAIIATQLLNISKAKSSPALSERSLQQRDRERASPGSVAVAGAGVGVGRTHSNSLDSRSDHADDADEPEVDGDMNGEAEQDSEGTMLESASVGARERNPTILIYEPKILRIFKAYNKAVSPHRLFDCSGHIMVMCLLHIVDFCCWARSSDQILNWISAEINENVDLRPRVRNGLALLFVYAVAAAKAEVVGNTDMFSVMQDADTGLGIVSRTSLKIYNDYLNYYTFLKSCLSGLILAGLVPENERSNQVLQCLNEVLSAC
jgi:hypothetical protein